MTVMESSRRPPKFRFSLITLLVSISLLSVLFAIVGRYMMDLREQQAAKRAAVHALRNLEKRSGKFVWGSVAGAQPTNIIRVNDPSRPLSVRFSGTALNDQDFAQLAKLTNLASLTIQNAPIEEQLFFTLQNLPMLQFVVLENTGASGAVLKRIANTNPSWQVFASTQALRDWSLERVEKLQTEGKLAPQVEQSVKKMPTD